MQYAYKMRTLLSFLTQLQFLRFDWITVHCRHSIHESLSVFLFFLNGCKCGLQYYGVIRGLCYFRQQSNDLWQRVSWMPAIASAWQLPSWAKMGSDGSEHCIGFVFSTILQKECLDRLASLYICVDSWSYLFSSWHIICFTIKCCAMCLWSKSLH